jgi:phytoene dehydrogenase-like protein
VPAPSASVPVVVIGAGLSGLTAARTLHAAGVPTLVVDAADAVGGRVRTDRLDGFRMDRGFQVYLDAYPEPMRFVDLAELDLRPFQAGALVRLSTGFTRVSDPFRDPLKALPTVFSPVGSLGDKLKVAVLRQTLKRLSMGDIFAREETTTMDALRTRWGFSSTMVDRFFRPFLGGITLDPELGASSRMFEFVFKMFSEGRATLPALGMQQLPERLAAPLPPGSIRLGAQVDEIQAGSIVLNTGERLDAASVIVATEAPAAERLGALTAAPATPTAGLGEVCFYYSAPTSPTEGEAVLVLNGTGDGPITNLSVPSDVSPDYAPPGRALVSVVVVGLPDESDGSLDMRVRAQLGRWYGPSVAEWSLLRSYRIRYALPAQNPPFLSPRDADVRVRPGLYRCGDWAATASINGAMRSGRRAAEAVLADRSAA